ncbi:Ras and Rab interactor 3 Ras interaction/interference protein 3 [Larimichthys crocea]|uniref:Ras and Rab interactor 3 Ras interaction/interference protein 3 n=1 Tax=Larimichthys crocea TaxID=215358 RepID=A0A6G0HDD5_LARCR|nr:Ras and Rab interactor 3 Ras interaction/interference protein 3 [Larimichthys crocea]
MSTSPPPSRPPVPLQSRAAPPLPPAPLRRTSSRKSTDRDAGEGREREKGQNPAKRVEGGERGEEKTVSKSGLLSEGVEQENNSQHPEEEVKKDTEKREKEDEKQEKEMVTDKEDDKQKSSSQCPSLVKKPTRPVPPPRRKPCTPETPVCPNQAGGGSTNQSVGAGAGMRVPPPSPARRPDVSLYSPQGGAVGNRPRLLFHQQHRGGRRGKPGTGAKPQVGSRSPKVSVRRTPTTVMLDRARYRLSTVLTGLISHDRRLTQRIVELARDPLSYFGNPEGIAEAALCKSVLKPLRGPIYQSLEELHTNNSSLKQLAQNQSVVLGSTTTALGITTAVPEAPAMEKISIKLNKLHLEYSPQKKIELLLKACKIIYDSMSVSSPGRAHGADDFLPVMMYVLARSNLSNLQMDVEYMMELMDPSLALGEGSYYLTTTYGALEHIKTFDQQRSATRQLSREVQDSIHRWERRRTLNQERMAQGSVRSNGIPPCFFVLDSYILSVYTDGVHRPLAPTELAVSVKNSCQPGSYCFVYHPIDQPSNNQPSRSCPTDPPPAPPAESLSQLSIL